ncbi:MAG: type I restriction endonuclease [Candidatus Kapabacteria bacterium]|nr:type I restriction endonuclease [Candidatus Kapabacteria bacterium]
MDFKDQIRQLGDRVGKLRENIHTEEATKNAFIMPFLQALGYDVFNPLEVVPEYVTDVGTKKGEKIDYAILKENTPIILVECKHHKQNLDLHDGQLLRYFHVSKAKFGILTNGIVYRFYTDLQQPNKMDERAFLEFSIDSIKDSHIEELKKFHKSYFDIETIVETASELMYMNELRSIASREMSEPSDDFTRHFARLVHQGPVSQKVVDKFRGYVKRTFSGIINDVLNERLQLAMAKQDAVNDAMVHDPGKAIEEKPETPKIFTSPEELEGFVIVKTLLAGIVDPKRVSYRDGQTYFSILLDDNNRKPIARLWFNSSKKYVGTFDEMKNEQRHEVSSTDDIHVHVEHFRRIVQFYESVRASDRTSASDATSDGIQVPAPEIP